VGMILYLGYVFFIEGKEESPDPVVKAIETEESAAS